MRHLLILLLALGLTACAGTPTACTDCDTPTVPDVPPGGSAAAADGGQTASQDPRIDERARITPVTAMGARHDGDTRQDVTQSEQRSLAGAPAVNQALSAPTAATAGGGVSPAIAQEESYQQTLQAMLMATKDPAERKELLEAMRQSLARSAAAAIPAPNLTYQPNAKVVNVAIGRSLAGGAPAGGDASALAENQRAEVEALAKAGAEAAKSIMDAQETPAPPTPAGSISPAPAVEPGPFPPAGPAPVAPPAGGGN